MSGEANVSLLVKDLNALNTRNFHHPIKHDHCLWTERSVKCIARQNRCSMLNEKTSGEEFDRILLTSG